MPDSIQPVMEAFSSERGDLVPLDCASVGARSSWPVADDVGVTHLPGAPGPVFVPDKLG